MNMKRHYLQQLICIFSFILTGGIVTNAQVIRVANNNANAPTGDNIFATAQEAIDAATAGDIIQIVPSLTTYGDITIDKQLTIYGIGYNPDKDIVLTSQLTNINLEGVAASGTLISGIDCWVINLATNTGSSYTQSDVTIASNKINRIEQDVSNTVVNLIIRNNLIYGQGNPARTILLAIDDKVVNAEIANNIIHGSGGVLAGGLSAGNFTRIRHNLFYGSDLAAWSTFHQIFDCIVTNNIFYGRGPQNGSGGSMDRNVFSNNLSFTSYDNTLPPVATGVGNTGLDNLPVNDPLFENLPLGVGTGAWQFTYDATLQAESPAIGAGTGGEDLGIFDGPFPFDNVNTGSVLPVIQEVHTSGLVNEGETLKVNITANSPN